MNKIINDTSYQFQIKLQAIKKKNIKDTDRRNSMLSILQISKPICLNTYMIV